MTIVASIHVPLQRELWLPCETFYDAHTAAVLMSKGTEADVEVWQGGTKTHVYRDGEGMCVVSVQ